MPRKISRLLLLTNCLLIIAACNNNEDSSIYRELLSRQPYSPLTDSIKKDPLDPELYYRRAVLLYKNNNYPPALEDFKKSWSLQKTEKYAVGVSNVLLGGKPDSAITFLQEALKILPGSIPLQLNLVQAYADVQKNEEALKICNDVLQAHPDVIPALMMKSDLLQSKNDTSGAIRVLEQARQYAPLNEEISYSLAIKYAETKNPKLLTLADSLQAADKQNEKGEPYYFRGLYYVNINQDQKALASFDQTISHDYTFLNAYIEKGKILLSKKNVNEAMKVFQLALTISPDFADAYYWIGQCQEKLGKKQDAKLSYQKAYSLDKSFEEAREAAERIASQ